MITSPKKLDLKSKSILEIGSGKGKFITDYAQAHPDTTCIAFEINKHVAYYIVLKVIEMNLSNVVVIIDDAERLDAYIDEHQLEAIYLNFSDPWPKKKHHKRRLTYPTKLQQYKKLLIDNGKLIFKTDHQTLYMDSVNYIQSVFQYVTYDEHAPLETNVSEYELKKRPLGQIYKIIAEVKHDRL